MIIKAMEIAEAVESAVFDETVKAQAQMLVAFHTMGADEASFMKALFAYSALLSATTGDKVAKVLISENDFDTMIDEIKEYSEIAEGIINE